MSRPTVCLDVGSGWVKALGIDADGEPSGCAQLSRRRTIYWRA